MVSDVILAERDTIGNALDALMHKADAPGHKNDWRRTVGMCEGDPIMQAILQEGCASVNKPADTLAYAHPGLDEP